MLPERTATIPCSWLAADTMRSLDDTALDVADEPVALIHSLAGRAAVPGERHPARVDQDPAPLAVVPDHRRQDREGDVVGGADTDARHDEVEEDVDAGPHLGDAREVTGVVRGRRRADADHGAW